MQIPSRRTRGKEGGRIPRNINGRKSALYFRNRTRFDFLSETRGNFRKPQIAEISVDFPIFPPLLPVVPRRFPRNYPGSVGRRRRNRQRRYRFPLIAANSNFARIANVNWPPRNNPTRPFASSSHFFHRPSFYLSEKFCQRHLCPFDLSRQVLYFPWKGRRDSC